MLDLRSSGDVVLVAARVRPGSRPGLKITDGGLVLSVAAPPEKGKANDEACRALARVLGVSAPSVSLRNGGTARRKVFAVRGVDAASARATLLALAR